jgi:hypothetical protein
VSRSRNQILNASESVCPTFCNDQLCQIVVLRTRTLTFHIRTLREPRPMENWSKLQSSLGSLNLTQSANKFAKGFTSSVQATRERLGQIAPEEITELPQGKVVLSSPYFILKRNRVQGSRSPCRCPSSSPPHIAQVRPSVHSVHIFSLTLHTGS